MPVEIFWVSGSPYSWRVLLAAEVKGVPYTSRMISLSKHEHRTPEYIAMNPRGRTPVMRDGDFVVTESVAMIVYLNFLATENPLFGESPRETTRVWEAVSQVTSDVEKAVVAFTQPIIFNSPTPATADPMKKAAEPLNKELKLLEERLAAGPWLCGEKISAADICAFPGLMFVLRAAGKDIARDLDLGLLPLAEKYPRLARWVARVEALPGYERTYPPHWKEG